MNSYYVVHVRIQELQGTMTESTLGVYKVSAWNLDELEAKARKAIPATPTYEFFRYVKQPPKGHEVKEIVNG